MSGSRALMLVSADAGGDVRRAVDAGLRPCPEFLRVEARHGVGLLDWSMLGAVGGARSVQRSLRHVAAAVGRLDGIDSVLSDGEHVGIPLAAALRVRGNRPRHVMIGHELGSRSKVRAFRALGSARSVDRILVHSLNQVPSLALRLGVPRERLVCVPYAVDAEFWQPQHAVEQRLVVAVGRDHRDHVTLADACDREPMSVVVTGYSLHSPTATYRRPAMWPANVMQRSFTAVGLRSLYAAAGVVVVPLIPTDHPFGITSVLEAMAMGRAVVASDTVGLRGIIEDGVTGLLVPAFDPARLRDAIRHLLDHSSERRRLGDNARRSATERNGLDLYVDRLSELLEETSPVARRAASS